MGREAFGNFAKRLVLVLPMLVLVSAVIFVVLRLLPADSLAMMLPPNATTEDIARLRSLYGLDRPLHEQYFIWLQSAFEGQFGYSIHLRQRVSLLIGKALPATLELVFLGLLVGCVLGVGGGLLMFATRGSRSEFVSETIGTVMLSVPEFLWALFLLLTLGVAFDLLPFVGRLAPRYSVETITGFLLLDTLLHGRLDIFVNALTHMALPTLALGLGFAPLIMRVLRSSLLEVEKEDFIAMSRLRGLSETRVLLNHALRNAALPTISLIGVQTAFLFGGTLLIEVIYSYPGLGSLMVEAVRSHDMPVIQTIALTYCALVLVLNAAIDSLYLVLNPRLSRASA